MRMYANRGLSKQTGSIPAEPLRDTALPCCPCHGHDGGAGSSPHTSRAAWRTHGAPYSYPPLARRRSRAALRRVYTAVGLMPSSRPRLATVSPSMSCRRMRSRSRDTKKPREGIRRHVRCPAECNEKNILVHLVEVTATKSEAPEFCANSRCVDPIQVVDRLSPPHALGRRFDGTRPHTGAPRPRRRSRIKPCASTTMLDAMQWSVATIHAASKSVAANPRNTFLPRVRSSARSCTYARRTLLVTVSSKDLCEDMLPGMGAYLMS
jgi:hypothetical protein